MVIAPRSSRVLEPVIVRIAAIGLLALALVAQGVGAAWSQPVLWPSNGHYYEVVNASLPWTDACADAASRTYMGLNGHLATITSQDEGDFIRALMTESTYWIGGYQPPASGEPDTDWTWVTGEAFSYWGFAGGAPDENGCGGSVAEDNIVVSKSATNSWNDAGWCVCYAYVVEYEAGAFGCPAIEEGNCLSHIGSCIPPCGACSDGIDNDGDGCADYPDDLGCTGVADNSEAEGGCSECADGLDNDGDGCVDFPLDPGCTSGADNSESDATCTACSDGVDNDGDGCADFPDDLGCSSRLDDSEAGGGCARSRIPLISHHGSDVPWEFSTAGHGTTFLSVSSFDTGSLGTSCISQGWTTVDLSDDGLGSGYGDFAVLFHGDDLVQEDPLFADHSRRNATCVWAFISGSTADYTCGGFLDQMVVPYANAFNQYIANDICSPNIGLAGSGSLVYLEFDVYRDLPFDNLVFYTWRVRSIVAGSPTGWRDRGIYYYGPAKDWFHEVQSIGDLIEANAEYINVCIGVVDLCGVWCGVWGGGGCHSHAPLIDNVRIYRVGAPGPTWYVQDRDLFQDNFSTDGTITGTVRADMAADIMPIQNPGIRPGDSVVVSVADPVQGLSMDGYTLDGPAVYMYVSVWPQAQIGKMGDALTDDPVRFPVLGSYTDFDGNLWHIVRMDTAFVNDPSGSRAAKDKFCVDLNDNLFTPGDTVCFFFSAKSADSYETYWTRATGTTDDINQVLARPMEFTCLPAGGWNRGGDILYVDAFDERGAQPFMESALDNLMILDLVDRYDIRDPSSLPSNGPGSRAGYWQLLGQYRKILWDSGDLEIGTIGDGTGRFSKSDDTGLLAGFLDGLLFPGGLYLSGDNIAYELSNMTGQGANNLRSFVDYVVTDDDQAHGGLALSPLVVGEPVASGAFFHAEPDTLVAYGGGRPRSRFDVLSPTGSAVLTASYRGTTSGGAILLQTTQNTEGVDVSLILSGFSFHSIRDDRATGLPDRAHHLFDILILLNNTPIPPTAASTGLINELGQNYPNPFNPTTAITFSVRRKSKVELTIFDVTGALVKTLVSDDRRPGKHIVYWDGKNGNGETVASGVYFYRLVAGDFRATRKLVVVR